MPRVPDDRLADILARSPEDCVFPGGTIEGLALDLRDSRSRESAMRAKVAELEARIAHLTAVADVDAMVHRYGSINDPSGVRAALAVNVATMERNKAVKALARANEALRLTDADACVLLSMMQADENTDGQMARRLRIIRDRAQRAQGASDAG